MTEESEQLGPSDDGTVLLDIGGTIGALILHTGEDLLLAEIEISRTDGEHPFEGHESSADGGHSHGDNHSHGEGHSHDGDHLHSSGHSHTGDGSGAPRIHVAVRERRGPSGIRYAAIYHGLREGEYQMWGVDGAPRDLVTVNGGHVVELDWR